MEQLEIVNNGPLNGEIPISGAKNAALPCMAASILTDDALVLSNLPAVRDCHTFSRLLGSLGVALSRDGSRIVMEGRNLVSGDAPPHYVQAMRASILVLGPLLARLGTAQVSLPGGCTIGARPVDLHLKALEKMGAEIELVEGAIRAKTAGLKGASIRFDTVTVTGTENLLMAATLAQGTTVLENAAREPEVVDLAEMLIKMGARIQGHGSGTIVIHGVSQLHGCHHPIIPDRIETGTYVVAAAMTRGRVTITQTRPWLLSRFLECLARAGCPFDVSDHAIAVKPHRGLLATDIRTDPHPGFPTDLQAQWMALMTQARGRSLVTETIFENRFMHVAELQRMGAAIDAGIRSAVVDGPVRLCGATVVATDIRASASLVLAGLAAKGSTRIQQIGHLDRGYGELEQKLTAAGALIRRLGTAKPVAVKGQPVAVSTVA